MHVPVLTAEILEYLDIKPNRNYIDCTAGFGGHSKAILGKNGPQGRVLAIETDPELAGRLQRQNIARLKVVRDSYTNLEKIVAAENFKPAHGVLADLGMASWHLEESGRGFSFQREEPLDMRYSQVLNSKSEILNSKQILNPKFKIQNSSELTAAHILNTWSEQEIAGILKEYGQEKFAKRIAKKIVEARKRKPIQTTLQLAAVIKEAVPGWYQHKRIHFATRTFQALRIASNRELENLRLLLPQTLSAAEPGARVAVISFHSLEDRLVKNFFREQAKAGLIEILTKKPVKPSRSEILTNPRARTAKMRVARLFSNFL